VAGHLSPGDADDPVLDPLVARADLDSLVRLVDERTHAGDWDGLRRLRDRCRLAVATGRQLWPAATLAEYRLALLAPGPWAAGVLTEDAGRFTLGPLTEVVAQHHRWDELGPLIDGPQASLVAHERVLRGEAVAGADHLPNVLEMPYALQPWEPDYALAEYTPEHATFPTPELPTDLVELRPQPGATEIEDHEVVEAVRMLVEPWTASSDGRAEVVAVEGGLAEALGALGLRRARVAPVDGSVALAWMAWAGASGGAHGRRRGGALGRFGAWWTAAALGGVVDRWPIPPDELGAIVTELDWWWWDAAEPALGWELQLVVEDPDDGLAWAISARDAR
jgi:hypothetical protein